MAKNIGIIKFTGKIAEVTGGVAMKGYNYLRRSAEQVKNPNTPGQRVQRTRFLCATSSANTVPLEAIAGFLPSAKAGKMSIRNMWVKQLLVRRGQNADWITVTGEGQPGTDVSAQINQQTVCFSQGSLEHPVARVDGEIPNTVTFNFDSGFPESASDNSAIHFVIYNQMMQIVLAQTKKVEDLREGSFGFEVPSNWAGTDVYAYIYLEDYTGSEEAFNEWYTHQAYHAASNSQVRAAIAAVASYSSTYNCGRVTIG